MSVTVGGRAPMKCPRLNGRYSFTVSTPVRDAGPSASTVAATVSPADPMTTITRVASEDPWYSNRRCVRPVSAARRSIARCTMPGTAR